ncbi:MAG: Plug domain-containing protein, partial [Deltaproteobacteria bacterium]
MQPASRARSASCRCALLLVLVLPAVVRAEDAASPASDHTHYTEEIQVTGHYENAVGSSDAASAGRITRQLVEDRPILRPGEVLELVPGLIITQHSGAGKANQYFLRGFNLDHGTDFLTTLDGMPVNLRTHAHGQGYTDLNFLLRWRSGHPLRRVAAAQPHGADRRQLSLRPCAPRRITAGGRRESPLWARGVPQRRSVGPRRRLPPRERRASLYALVAGRDLGRDSDGLLRPLGFDRPDPVARRGDGTDRSLRRHRSHDRRKEPSLQPLRRLPAGARRRPAASQRVCREVPPEPVLQLHLLSRRPGERRPDRAGGQSLDLR